MISLRNFIILVVFITFTLMIAVVSTIFLQRSSKSSSQSQFSEAQEALTNQQLGCPHGRMPDSMYLDEYIVQPGDTLLSIANRELGSTSRVNEIININKNRGGEYHSLYTSQVIEVGWSLYLPVKSLPPNSGDLVPQMGKVSVSSRPPFSGRMLVITTSEYFPEGQPVSFSDDTVFLGSDYFTVDDCVMIIRDEGTDTDILFARYDGLDTLRTSDEEYTLDEVVFPKEDVKCDYEFLGPEVVMRKYIVREEDRLASIAFSELGDTSRIDEIIEANRDRYSSLKTNSFIEIGWELLLPPEWTPATTGHLTGFAGTLIKEDQDGFWVSKDLDYPGQSNFKKTFEVTRFGKREYERGDCVVILNNRGTAVGISTQDVDYLNLFKYGSTQ